MGMIDPNCLFCRIIKGEVPARYYHKGEDLIAIADINPVAPFHALIIPTDHIPTLGDLTEEHADLIGRVHLLAAKLAEEHGIAERGYRVVANVGQHGGQIVEHVHFHLLGGRTFGWPPG